MSNMGTKAATSSRTPGDKPRGAVSFAAIEQSVETAIVAPTESKVGATDRYRWGDRDLYPGYLSELYDTVTTLGSVIDGCTDFTAGDDVLFNGERDRIMNKGGQTALDLIKELARNAWTFGGFAIEVVRDRVGDIAEVYCIDMQNLRTNKDNTVFWYSEKWGTSRPDPVEMSAYMASIKDRWAGLDEEQRNAHASSVLYVKARPGKVYPRSPFAAAVKACEIERCVDDFHINNLENGFVSSMIVNMNNGVPEDAEKAEIERGLQEKFAGHSNAGRIMVSFNPDKENAATFEVPKVEDFGDRYDALAKRSRQAIFTAFRANPNLFGIPTESLGFSSEEYESAFKLFNRTQIRPMQRKILDAFSKIYGTAAITIVPFSLEGSTETNVN